MSKPARRKVTAATSPARRAQLERIKLQRRLKREKQERTERGRQERTEIEIKRKLPTLNELIVEVQRQSMGGTMPTIGAYNMARPTMWGTAQECLEYLKLTWAELAQEAGLSLRRAKMKEEKINATER